MPTVNIRVTDKTQKLRRAPNILVAQLTGGLDGLGKLLREGVRSRVRVFRGDERKGIKYQVSGKDLNKTLEVYGELVQHFIDEMGLPPGTFPPSDVGSLLFQWVEKKASGWSTERKPTERRASHVHTRRPRAGPPRGARKSTRHKRAAAKGRSKGPRAQSARAKPNPKALARQRFIKGLAFVAARAIFENGIRPGRPFALTLEANKRRIFREVQNAFTRAVNEINR